LDQSDCLQFQMVVVTGDVKAEANHKL
jgi:hypothetical protein